MIIFGRLIRYGDVRAESRPDGVCGRGMRGARRGRGSSDRGERNEREGRGDVLPGVIT